MAIRLLVLLAWLWWSGCGGSDAEVDAGPAPADAAADDGGIDGGAEACGDVGGPCEADCSGNLRCYESVAGGFCAPERTECGGFAGADCRDPDHLCVTLAGNTVGACLTASEKACVCARRPDTVEGCDR